jgi:IS30 family transposase
VHCLAIALGGRPAATLSRRLNVHVSNDTLLRIVRRRGAPEFAAPIALLPDREPASVQELRRSLTWDQGAEMAQHAALKIDAGIQVYFCDPQSPWQRGANENTNGLLRQYFPKGTDLCVHSAETLAAVAATLNARPRKTLGWKTPAEALDRCLA